MKKLVNLTLAAILSCTTSLFVACSFEDNPANVEVPEAAEVPKEPTTDQLAVKVNTDMPTAVLSSFSESSMGGALTKRVSKTTTEIDADTKLVLFKGADILSFSNDDWMNMARVYINNGYIAIERATDQEMMAVAVGLGLAVGMVKDDMLAENGVEVTGNDASGARAYTNDLQRRIANARALTRAEANEEEDPDGIDFEMFILSPDKCFTQAPYHDEETHTATITDGEGNETSKDVKSQNLQNPYRYGLLADGAADYLNQEEKERAAAAAAEERASTRGGAETAMNDAMSCSDEFVISHTLAANDFQGNVVIRNNMGTTTIRSWSAHDFGRKMDFYYVDEKVVIRMGGKSSDYNATFYWGPYSRDKWYNKSAFLIHGDQRLQYYGSWLSEIKHSLDLTGNGTIDLEACLPATDNATQQQSVTVGTVDTSSETTGWNIGFSAGPGKKAEFNFGYSSSTTNTHSNSFTMTTSTVSNSLKVTRNTVGTKVTFDYTAGVKPDWTWTPFQHDLAPDILTNDCEVHNTACWKVKDPSDYYRLQIATEHQTGCMAVFNLGIAQKLGNWYYRSRTWNDSYRLKQPCRYMGEWNCEITTTGEKRVADASELFRKYLQESVAETPFKKKFNVAETKQGETTVMAGVIHTVSDKMKEGSRKRRMIDNHAKELGIDSYTITWFAEDESVTTEYNIKGQPK